MELAEAERKKAQALARKARKFQESPFVAVEIQVLTQTAHTGPGMRAVHTKYPSLSRANLCVSRFFTFFPTFSWVSGLLSDFFY